MARPSLGPHRRPHFSRRLRHLRFPDPPENQFPLNPRIYQRPPFRRARSRQGGRLLVRHQRRPRARPHRRLYNDNLIDVARVDAALVARQETGRFNTLLRRASIGLALTFLASAPVNFLLALYVLRSPPGTAEFNAELGKMHWLAFLVIALPSMAAMMFVFWKLMSGLVALTGLTQDEIFRETAKAKKTAAAP